LNTVRKDNIEINTLQLNSKRKIKVCRGRSVLTVVAQLESMAADISLRGLLKASLQATDQ
jgi:hypothetical protein